MPDFRALKAVHEVERFCSREEHGRFVFDFLCEDLALLSRSRGIHVDERSIPLLQIGPYLLMPPCGPSSVVAQRRDFRRVQQKARAWRSLPQIAGHQNSGRRRRTKTISDCRDVTTMRT